MQFTEEGKLEKSKLIRDDQMMKNVHVEVKRINGYLKEVVTFLDSSGKPISHVVNPIMTELRPRDILQIFVGVMIFGAPLCYTEEIWNLSNEISLLNLNVINIVAFILLSSFVYMNFYRFKIKGNVINFFKRSFAIYFITFLTIGMFLFLIGKLPLSEDLIIGYKRISLIAFPSLFSAAISDLLK